jgi:hypothetical protein
MAIQGAAFQFCASLTNISIPFSVTSIGDFAFYSCTGLTSITIPNSVTSIGTRAFDSSSLIRVNFLGNAPSLGSIPFNNTDANLKIYRYSTKSGWSSTFGGKDVLLIDMPSKGLRTFGFSNVSSGKTSINKQNLGGGKINLNKKYLYKVTGTGLTPNINGLRFYDSGLIYNGKKSFYSEDGQYAIWYVTSPVGIWLIGSIANIGTYTSNAWGKVGATDTVAGSYIAAGDRVGAVTVSAI